MWTSPEQSIPRSRIPPRATASRDRPAPPPTGSPSRAPASHSPSGLARERVGGDPTGVVVPSSPAPSRPALAPTASGSPLSACVTCSDDASGSACNGATSTAQKSVQPRRDATRLPQPVEPGIPLPADANDPGRGLVERLRVDPVEGLAPRFRESTRPAPRRAVRCFATAWRVTGNSAASCVADASWRESDSTI